MKYEFLFKEPTEKKIPRYQRETLAFSLKRNHILPPMRNFPPLRHQPRKNMPQRPEAKAPPPVINKEHLLGPTKPVFKVEAIKDNGMLPKIDEGGCFRESSLTFININEVPQQYDVPQQSTSRDNVHGTHGLTNKEITCVVEDLKDETDV